MSLHYLVKCQQRLKATIENKTSVTTHLKKLTTGNNVFIVSIIVQITVTFCRVFLKSHVQCVRLAAGRCTLKCVGTEVLFLMFLWRHFTR